jgi:hypothetical protein
MDATVLSLWFYGEPGNDTNEPMYIKLTDNANPVHTAKVFYDGSPYNIKKEQWQQWNIVLQEFEANNPVINLSDVAEITIGFGEGIVPESSGDGIVYFDDIRLYFNKCFPGDYPACDFEPDCRIDLYDFAIFALAWLTNSEQPNYNPVCDISLPHDYKIDVFDLARFCDYWLWQEAGGIMGLGYGETLYTAPPPQQPQFQEESAKQQQACDETAEPVQTEPSEELDIEEIQETIEILQILLSDEQLKQDMLEQEGEQAWQQFLEIAENWLEELIDLL